MTMRTLFTIIAFTCFVAIVSLAETAADERADRAEVLRKLRLEYAASPEYNPYATEIIDIRKRSVELLEKEDLTGAIQEAAKGWQSID
jgi:hypothetical protein